MGWTGSSSNLIPTVNINNSTQGNALAITGNYTPDTNQGAQIKLLNNQASSNGGKSIRINNVGTFQIIDNAYVNALLNVTDAGAVSLNGSSPSLTMSGSYSTPQAAQYQANHGAGVIGFNDTRWSADGFGGWINLSKSRGAAVGTNTIVNSGDTMGQINFNGADGTNFYPGACILASVDGAPTAGSSMPGALFFQTSPTGTVSPVTRFWIGNLGQCAIGGVGATDRNFNINKNITGATTAFGMVSNGTVQTDVTSQACNFRSTANVVAATFTLPAYYHYQCLQGTIGAGATLQTQTGYYVDSSMTGGTVNNYGFYGAIAVSGSINWNLYMNGNAPNFLSGALGVGTNAITAAGAPTGVRINRGVTGATTMQSVLNESTVQSDVTVRSSHFSSSVNTAAATFTLTDLIGFSAFQGTIGAGCTVTNEYGFFAGSFSGATNNYGFFSNLTAGTSTYNFFANGNAPNRFVGKTGIGAAGSVVNAADPMFRVSANLTGNTTSYAQYNDSPIQSDVTATAGYYTSNAQTAAATFTLGTLLHFYANQGTFGAGSTVTSQMGFYAAASLTGGTNNYGFYSALNSGTNIYAFYGAGTAASSFGGSVLSRSASGGVGYTTGSGGTVTQATSRTTGVTLNAMTGAITLVSAAGSATYQTFTVTNSSVAATDVIILNQKSGADKYLLFVTAVAAGSFAITFATTGGTTTEQPVFNFAIIKGSTS